MQKRCSAFVPLLMAAACVFPSLAAAKVHTVVLGAVRRVPYMAPDADPNDKSEEATTLKVRPLLVDGAQKEWTAGDLHEVTDRTFVVRRVMRINDALPGAAAKWTWQPGPWLMVDRVTARITALHLPDFDAGVSNVVWFRDYAAYCGVHVLAKSTTLTAMVFELGARKAAVSAKIGDWPPKEHVAHACELATWQQGPMRATIKASGREAMTFAISGTTSLVEDGESGDEEPVEAPK